MTREVILVADENVSLRLVITRKDEAPRDREEGASIGHPIRQPGAPRRAGS